MSSPERHQNLLVLGLKIEQQLTEIETENSYDAKTYDFF